MPFDKLKTLHIIRSISYLYFLGIVAFWLTDSFSAGHMNWPIIIIGSLLLLQLIFRIPTADLMLGIIMGLLSFYMVLAVTSDLIDHFNGSKPVKTVAVYFGFGYGIFGSALVAAIALLYVYEKKKKITNG